MYPPLEMTISYAQSIDGKIGTITGESRWISGSRTLKLAHRLRRDHQAIITGIGTVLRDDPELTCRLKGCSSPLRVILDSHLRLPLEAKIVRTALRYPTLVCTTEQGQAEKRSALEAAGLRLVSLAADDSGRVAVRQVVSFLAGEGHGKVLVEGGGKVITSFIAAGLVTRMVIVTAPLLIGSGVTAIGDLGIRRLEEAVRPRRVKIRRMGRDLVWELLL